MSFEDKMTPISTGSGGSGRGSVTNTALNITAIKAKPDAASYARLQFTASGTFTDTNKIVRLTISGETPTTSIGFVLGDGDFYDLPNVESIRNAKIISNEGSEAVNVEIQYFVN